MMRTLYHFTRKRHIAGIAERGLVPAIGDRTSPVLTLGVPVVWLTANKNPLGWLPQFHDDAYCLTVRPRRGELFHWRTWLLGVVGTTSLGKRIAGAEVLAAIDRDPDCHFSVSNSFYVHLGTIPRDRIKLIEPIAVEMRGRSIPSRTSGNAEGGRCVSQPR